MSLISFPLFALLISSCNDSAKIDRIDKNIDTLKNTLTDNYYFAEVNEQKVCSDIAHKIKNCNVECIHEISANVFKKNKDDFWGVDNTIAEQPFTVAQIEKIINNNLCVGNCLWFTKLDTSTNKKDNSDLKTLVFSNRNLQTHDSSYSVILFRSIIYNRGMKPTDNFYFTKCKVNNKSVIEFYIQVGTNKYYYDVIDSQPLACTCSN